ncbi:MAG: hypothetical protein ACHQNE_06450 [Candidatus Kapaibacterium sp.]
MLAFLGAFLIALSGLCAQPPLEYNFRLQPAIVGQGHISNGDPVPVLSIVCLAANGYGTGSPTSIGSASPAPTWGCGNQGGIIKSGNKPKPLSVQTDSCFNIVPVVEAWESNEMNSMMDVAYDTMRWYLTHCYSEAKPEEAWGDFNSTFSHASQMKTLAGVLETRQWIMSVRFLSSADGWYCFDVVTIAGTYNDLRASRAIAQFLIQNPRCSAYAAQFSRDYDLILQNQRTTWADTDKNPNVDVFDTTIPSLHDLGLDSLLDDATSVVTETAMGPQIILNARITENPVQKSTSVWLSMSREAFVHIDVFDLLGRKVEGAGFNSVFEPGSRGIPLDMSNAPTGAYYMRISTSNNEVRTLKITKE